MNGSGLTGDQINFIKLSFEVNETTNENMIYKLTFPSNFQGDSNDLFTNLVCVIALENNILPQDNPEKMIRIPCEYFKRELKIFSRKFQIKSNENLEIYIFGFKFPKFKLISNPQLLPTYQLINELKTQNDNYLDLLSNFQNSNENFILEGIVNSKIVLRSVMTNWDTSLNPNNIKTIKLESKSNFQGMESDIILTFGSINGFYPSSVLQIILPDEFFDDYIFDQRQYKYYERIYKTNPSMYALSQNCEFFFEQRQKDSDIKCRFNPASKSYLIFNFPQKKIIGLNQKSFLREQHSTSFLNYLNSSNLHILITIIISHQ